MHAVMYTDGSAKPVYSNTYKIGWGIHGYLYDAVITKPVSANEYVHTHKGYIKKTSLTPEQKTVEPLKYIDAFGSQLEAATNNVAELLAVLNALDKAKEFTVESILIITDSEYVKRGILEWMPKWLSNGWTKPDGQLIANDVLWKTMHIKLRELETDKIAFAIEWIKAHDERLGNVQADLLASVGCNYSFSNEATIQFTLTEPKGYWKADVDRHPLLNFNRVYFNSLEQYNTPGHYYQADPGGNDFIIGKRLPETGYSILRLNEPDHVIEAVKKKQYEVSRHMNAIFLIKLDSTHNKVIHPYIATYGHHALYRYRKNNNLIFIDDRSTPITTEINPTGLSLRAIDCFNVLEDILDHALILLADPSQQGLDIFKIQLQDITEVFFDMSGKKTLLKSEYGVGHSAMSLDIMRDGIAAKIPYILGTDCPSRNNLKRLESMQPNMTLVTYAQADNSFKYCTLIRCENAVGLWSNYYASKILT